MAHDKPATIAHVSITQQCWQLGNIKGEVRAADYTWQFQWRFRYRQLLIKPSLGKALIQEPLGRFLESCDYKLESGSNYTFTIRAKI